MLPPGPKGAQHGNGRIRSLLPFLFVIETGVLEISKKLILKIKVQQISFLYVGNLLWPRMQCLSDLIEHMAQGRCCPR